MKQLIIIRIAILVCLVILASCDFSKNDATESASLGKPVQMDSDSEKDIPYPIEEFQDLDISEGFRNIKWGTDVSRLKHIMKYHAGTACGDFYRRPTDDESIFDYPIAPIRYHFHKGKFFEAIVSTAYTIVLHPPFSLAYTI